MLYVITLTHKCLISVCNCPYADLSACNVYVYSTIVQRAKIVTDIVSSEKVLQRPLCVCLAMCDKRYMVTEYSGKVKTTNKKLALDSLKTISSSKICTKEELDVRM